MSYGLAVSRQIKFYISLEKPMLRVKNVLAVVFLMCLGAGGAAGEPAGQPGDANGAGGGSAPVISGVQGSEELELRVRAANEELARQREELDRRRKALDEEAARLDRQRRALYRHNAEQRAWRQLSCTRELERIVFTPIYIMTPPAP